MTISYPKVSDPKRVGTYPALAKAGGGYVWDEVLEYRVWLYPGQGAEDLAEGSDYYYAFETCEEALDFSHSRKGATAPIALVLQCEYIDEPSPGQYLHKKEERVTEWPISFLSRPKRDELTILEFIAPNAPPNRLDILRGLAPRP